MEVEQLTKASKPIFKEAKPVKLCSAHRCANGHEWSPTMAIAECPGCKAPVVAIKVELCPFCGEPAELDALRTDYVIAGAGIAPCGKVSPNAESGVIEIKRGFAEEVERRMEKKA